MTAKIEYAHERELLLSALAEAMCESFDAVVAESGIADSVSRAHRKRMARIISGKKVISRRARKTLIVLVAAALLLVGCYICREQIGILLREMKGDEGIYRFSGTLADAPPSFYKLNYVPDGYVYFKADSPTSVEYIEPISGDEIYFTAYGHNVSIFKQNDGKWEKEVFLYNGIEITHMSGALDEYFWTDGYNYCHLTVFDGFERDEVCKIIDGLERYILE